MFQLNTIQRITETAFVLVITADVNSFQLNTIQRITETLRLVIMKLQAFAFQLNTIQRITETCVPGPGTHIGL